MASVALVTDGIKEQVRRGKAKARTLDGIEQRLKLIKQRFGLRRVDQIRSGDVRAYLDERRVQQSARTAQLDATDLRRVFGYCADRGWLPVDPMHGLTVKGGKAKPVHIPKSEHVLAVLAWLRERHSFGRKAADFIEFLALSGCRMQGAQTIRWEDIDFARGTFTVVEKGSQKRIVDMSKELRAFLLARRQESGQLFSKCRDFGKADRYHPRKHLEMAVAELGIPRFTFHALRHFFATRCLEAGISASTVAGWLGHTDNGVLVMRLYGNHLSRTHFAEQAQRIPPLAPEAAAAARTGPGSPA